MSKPISKPSSGGFSSISCSRSVGCGHLTGDFVLAEIAGTLKASILGCDAVIRYGGDEFLIILADSSDSGAQIVIDRINARLADWNDAAPLENFQVSVSVGAAEWHDGDTLDEILDRADHTMYEQKNSTRSS
ncbi:MAG TPA: GGDEF domain-containing protein [Terriglobales bacterium]|nr:GGDEF domain-containing protein [Terriglobales bacterium]